MNCYIHVPFCVKKCAYCAFYSVPVTSEAEERYLDVLEREIASIPGAVAPRSVYIGGGTPSCLGYPNFSRLLEIARTLDFRRVEEFNMEVNPGTLDEARVKAMVRAGVNRVSVGVQSLDDNMLRFLGRIHSKRDVYRTVDLLRKHGLCNINLDLIFAVPGQSLEDVRRDVEELLSLGTPHLSCYEMTYEEGTPLTRWVKERSIPPNEALSCDMYDLILERLEAADVRAYEVSNFAKPGFECQHNIGYWRGTDYYGAGPAACSLIHGVRYANPRSLETYCGGDYTAALLREADDSATGHPGVEIDRISPRARAGEIAAIGLRMVRGWDFAEFYRTTGYRMELEWRREMERIYQWGYGEYIGTPVSGFRLNRRGLRFADLAAEQFIVTSE